MCTNLNLKQGRKKGKERDQYKVITVLISTFSDHLNRFRKMSEKTLYFKGSKKQANQNLSTLGLSVLVVSTYVGFGVIICIFKIHCF